MSLINYIIYIFRLISKSSLFLIEQTSIANVDRNTSTTCIPYSHQEIAYFVGMNRVTVTNVLHHFKELGYIKLGYKKVMIIDKKALEEYCQK